MASLPLTRGLGRAKMLSGHALPSPIHATGGSCEIAFRSQSRQVVVGRRSYSQQSQQRPRFSSRLRTAWNNSRIQWYQVPVGVGIGFLGFVQFYKVHTREKERQEENELGVDGEGKPKKRARIRPDGPW